MADNYKFSGRVIPITSASAAIANGAFVYQEGFVGVALNAAASGASLDVATEGVWELAVPSGVVKGDVLYANLAAESVSLTLTEDSGSGNTMVGIAVTDRDTDGNAQVKLTGDGHPAVAAGVESGSVASAADELAIPVTARYVAKTTGADAEALTLADGFAGQTITISLVVDGGGSGTLTPDTASGWATIVFADAGDTATLTFVDDTVGWVIDGTAGVAAPPAITI